MHRELLIPIFFDRFSYSQWVGIGITCIIRCRNYTSYLIRSLRPPQNRKREPFSRGLRWHFSCISSVSDSMRSRISVKPTAMYVFENPIPSLSIAHHLKHWCKEMLRYSLIYTYDCIFDADRQLWPKSIEWGYAASFRWDQFCKDQGCRLEQFRPNQLASVIKRLGADFVLRAPVADTRSAIGLLLNISVQEWCCRFLTVRHVSIKPNLLWDSLKILKILKAIISRGTILKKTLKIYHLRQNTPLFYLAIRCHGQEPCQWGTLCWL